MDLDLEKVRLLPLEQIGEKEIEFLNDHKEELSDDEKWAFQGFLKADEVPAETTPAPVVTPTPEATPAPAAPEPFIKSAAQLDTYLEGKKKEWDAANVSEAEQEKLKNAATKLYDEGQLPTDWNDFGAKIITTAEDRIMAKIDARDKEREETSKKAVEQRDEILKGYQAEFKELEKDGKVPALDSEEGKKAMEQIFKVGIDNSKVTVHDAFDLWSKLPEEFGGGFKTGNTAEKQRINKQKEAAGKIGSGAGAPPATDAPKFNYPQLHNRKLDTLLEERMKQA